MKYAIGIVTYQPDMQRLSENVRNALGNPVATELTVDNLFQHVANLLGKMIVGDVESQGGEVLS